MDAKFRDLERRVAKGDRQALSELHAAMLRRYEAAALDGDIDATNILQTFVHEHGLNSPQPEWKFLDNLGDVNFLDRGGYLIYIDTTWTYNAEMEVVYPDEDRPNRIGISRLGLESFTYVDGILSDNEFHPDHAVWFADDLERIANAMGTTPGEMIEGLVGGAGWNIRDRASVYIDLVAYYGVGEFDQDPLILRRREATARYKDIPGVR